MTASFEFRVNGQRVDLTSLSDLRIILKKNAESLEDLSKQGGGLSYQFELPVTSQNKLVLGSLNEAQVRDKYYTSSPFLCTLSVGSSIVFQNAELIIEGVTRTAYKCSLRSADIGWANALKARTLRDIESLKKLSAYKGLIDAIAVNAAVDTSGIYTHCDTYDVLFPLVFYAPPFVPNIWGVGTRISRTRYVSGASGFNANGVYPALPAGKEIFGQTSYALGTNDNDGNAHFSFRDQYPAIYLRSIIRAIFEDIGYAVTGSIFESNEFRKLCLLYTNKEGAAPWNWGTLAALLVDSDGSVKDTYLHRERTPSVVNFSIAELLVYINLLNNKSIQPLNVQTNYSAAFRYDENVPAPTTAPYDAFYIVPANGTYRVRVQMDATEASVGSFKTYFIAVRNDINSEFADRYSDIYVSNSAPDITFNTNKVTVIGEIPAATGAFTFDETADIQCAVGEVLTVLVAIVVLQTSTPTTIHIGALTNLSVSIDNVTAPVDLDPALFLPEVNQGEFVKDVFKMFNLFAAVDPEAKTVLIETYDRFFLPPEDALDLTYKVEPSSYESEVPEQAATYRFSYAPEPDDALLTEQDLIVETEHIETNYNYHGQTENITTPKLIGATAFQTFQIVNDTSLADFVAPTYETAQEIVCPYITTKELRALPQNGNNPIRYDWLARLVKVKQVVTLNPNATLPYRVWDDAQPVGSRDYFEYVDRHIELTFDDTGTPTDTTGFWSLSWEAPYGLYKQFWQRRLFKIFRGETVIYRALLTADQFEKLNLRRLVRVQNQLYSVQQIDEFNPYDPQPCKLTLLKI